MTNVPDLSVNQKRAMLEHMANTIAGIVLDGLSSPEKAMREQWSAWSAALDHQYANDPDQFGQELTELVKQFHARHAAELGSAPLAVHFQLISWVLAIVWERMLQRDNLRLEPRLGQRE